MRSAALALLAGLALPAAARAAEPDTYIFDVLAQQPYRANFARLVKSKSVPDWVRAISVQGAGAAGPSKTVDIGGMPYRLDRVCEVGAPCATDRVDVLWAPRGAKAWAALVVGGEAPLMLGDPKGAQAAALRAAADPAATPRPPASALTPAASGPPPKPAGDAAIADRAPPPAPAEADPYIFDVLSLQPYKGNFARLVKGRGVPGWVKAISAQGAGAAGPSRTVAVGGTPYRLDRVCEVGKACATHRIDVLWAPRGARVWAALVEDGKPPVMLGDPRGPQAESLASASGATPASQAPARPAPAR